MTVGDARSGGIETSWVPITEHRNYTESRKVVGNCTFGLAGGGILFRKTLRRQGRANAALFDSRQLRIRECDGVCRSLLAGAPCPSFLIKPAVRALLQRN
jgi:hypothetical protein